MKCLIFLVNLVCNSSLKYWACRYQNWGQAVPHRPVEDNAFAVARFFQRGGSFQNYYMVRVS